MTLAPGTSAAIAEDHPTGWPPDELAPTRARDRDVDERQLVEPRPFPTVDLAALAEAGVPAPELLCSELLYRGGLHSLAGPPDCGKSTIAYLWLLELLAQGEAVVLVDEESGREQVVEKLLALGAEPRHLERLAYVEFPGRRWDQADRAGLRVLVDEWKPALVVFDSSAAFLTLADRDEDRAPDVTAFYKVVLLAIARESGAAVVVLDHVTKEQKGGGYARGSGAKKANVDVLFMLDPIRPFSRHQSGLLKLTVPKDRRGYLHRAFEVRVEVERGTMALTFERVEAAGLEAGLTPAAAKVLEALRTAREPLTIRSLIDRIADRHGHGLRRETVSRELNRLLEDGLVDASGEVGASKLWIATTGGVTGRDIT